MTKVHISIIMVEIRLQIKVNQLVAEIVIKPDKEGFTNITKEINSWIRSNNINQGIIVLSLAHTSCSLIINENADSRVLEDLASFMNALVPEIGFNSMNGNSPRYEYLHKEEGLDDMPAHIKTILTSSTLSLSIQNGSLQLGTWQAIYLWEHRYHPTPRKLNLHVIAD